MVARLADHDWPGNVRQLRNVVRQLVIANRGKDRAEMIPVVERLLVRQTLTRENSVATPERLAPAKALAENPAANRRKPADVTEGELREALRASRWDLAAAAEKLGISRASMYLLFERFPGFRTAGDLEADEIIQCHRDLGGNRAGMAERLEVSERALARRIRELGLP
ncbi:MAG TPA: helix-turn-helix domain-containing protein [Polyangium sp.]|nr:helix-turn-helix domain-containing protein [Polyangium sp.]